MGWEHEAETVWQAQTLYCVDRLSFDAVAQETGVAASTLKRWSEKYGWREKREELAQAEADIRVNKVKARAVTLKALLDKPKAELAFAVSALESQALKEAEAARKGALLAAASEQAPELSIKTPADAISALQKAVEQRLAYVLSRPECDILRESQNVKKTLELIEELQAKYVKEDSRKAEGFSADTVDKIKKQILGIRG